MAKLLPRTKPLRVERQLDGSACEAFDCGPASACVAIDWASNGLIRPSTEQVRKKAGIGCQTTTPYDWARAIAGFEARFEREGLLVPKTKVVQGADHADLWRFLTNRRGVISAVHYGTVAKRKRRLWASRSYRGNHALFHRGTREPKHVPTFDPLADGRFAGIPDGTRRWPWWLLQAATGNVRDQDGRRIYPQADRWIGLVIAKAVPVGEPESGIELPDDLPLPDELIDEHWGWLHDRADGLEDDLVDVRERIEEWRPHVLAPSTSEADADEGLDLEGMEA